MQLDRKAIVGESDNHSMVATPGPQRARLVLALP
jgi:hypothetical protein